MIELSTGDVIDPKRIETITRVEYDMEFVDGSYGTEDIFSFNVIMQSGEKILIKSQNETAITTERRMLIGAS